MGKMSISSYLTGRVERGSEGRMEDMCVVLRIRDDEHVRWLGSWRCVE